MRQASQFDIRVVEAVVNRILCDMMGGGTDAPGAPGTPGISDAPGEPVSAAGFVASHSSATAASSAPPSAPAFAPAPATEGDPAFASAPALSAASAAPAPAGASADESAADGFTTAVGDPVGPTIKKPAAQMPPAEDISYDDALEALGQDGFNAVAGALDAFRKR